MKTIIKKNTWSHFALHGWGNGYVLIPKGHPAHGKDYDDIMVDVHGGLTFACPAKEWRDQEDLTEDEKECWVVGFDTAHWGDDLRGWPKSRVISETKRLAEQLTLMQ